MLGGFVSVSLSAYFGVVSVDLTWLEEIVMTEWQGSGDAEACRKGSKIDKHGGGDVCMISSYVSSCVCSYCRNLRM